MESFVVNSSNVKSRIDPTFFLNIEFLKKLKSKFDYVPLEDLLKKKPQYGANLPAIDGSPDNDYRYIRITDINEFGQLRDDEWKTAPVIEEKYILEEDDLLFARSGATAGKTYIYTRSDGKAIFAGYLIRFKIDNKKISPKFVFYYTQLKRYKLWVKSIQRPSGQPNINSEEFKSLEIPLLPEELQNKFIARMDSVYALKKQKESDADELLESIYYYAVKELNLKYNIIIRKTFTVNLNEINARIDPLYCTISLYDFLKTCSYKTKLIREVTDYIKSGFAAGRQDQDLTGEGIIQIRPTNITEDREFVFERNVYIGKNKISEKKEDVLAKGEVLFNNTNSQEQVGKTRVFNLDGAYFCSNHITRIKVKDDEILPAYLALILNVYQKYGFFFRICTNWNNQSGVNGTLLESLRIPVPKLKEQEKIVKEVEDRRKEAFKLRLEAIQDLENAKADIEKLILRE